MLEGLITKVNSDTFTVKVGFEYFNCKARGIHRYKKEKPIVGDHVLIDKNKLTIESIKKRKNKLDRPPVSNIDIALIVTSLKSPDISLSLLDRLISIITIENITPVIIFTKSDLGNKEEIDSLKGLVNYYNNIGIKTFMNSDILKIKNYLKNKIVCVCGQTGAGKSTLINKLDESLNIETKEISKALGRGVHTTRMVSLYEIDDFYIVDTPGFSSIDINKYNKEDIKNSFIEFNNYDCKFKDCNHINELGCSIINNNDILKSRYDSYIKFIKEIK